MGSQTFDGIRFQVFSLDHPPAHVHGFYGDTLAVVELHAEADRCKLRWNSTRLNAKRSDVKKIFEAAIQHRLVLLTLWEATHGNAH